MTDGQALAVVRTVHTTIYLVMASAALVVLYGGVTGAHGRWLWISAGLIGLESLVFAASGLKCPLTAVALRYGAQERATLFDTFLPEPITRHTFHVFGPIVVVGFVLLALRWWWFGWA